MIVLSIFIALGFFYKVSTFSFFLIFTYIELIDKTNYLNHYYFVSLISFILIFIPAHKHFSFDCFFRITKPKITTPVWSIKPHKISNCHSICISVGIAKLNWHWLFEAQLLFNWLKHQSDIPLIGKYLTYDITAYIFSWGGALFDLFIIFFLINKKSRIIAYLFIVIFHVLTALMFSYWGIPNCNDL